MISDQLEQIRSTIPAHVTLVAVSKTKPVSDIQEAYNANQKHFGENKVQELTDKFENLPKDIHWHMIGHLQTNKVKYIAPFVYLIHGVDSFKLLKEINKQALKNQRVIPILLQFYIANEDTKFGFDLQEAKSMIESSEFKELKNVAIHGVMGMATFTENEIQIKEEFHQLVQYFNILRNDYFSSNSMFKEISMGMSGDYKLAIECGSTMIRVGSSIFGNRQYASV